MLEVGLLARDDGVGQTLQGGSSGLDALNEGLGFAEKDAAGRGIGLAPASLMRRRRRSCEEPLRCAVLTPFCVLTMTSGTM